MQEPRSTDQEVTTQQLASELAELVEDELREMVRTLQDAEPASLFGPTEFKIRALALQIATKAYQQRLEQKKTRPAKLAGRSTWLFVRISGPNPRRDCYGQEGSSAGTGDQEAT